MALGCANGSVKLLESATGKQHLIFKQLADKWEGPGARVFGSQLGRHGFKVFNPKQTGPSDPSEGVLFRLDAEGREQILWRAKLVNMPVRVLVEDTGKFVATVDTWGSTGFAHALIIYGDKGTVIRDFQLEDLFTEDEILTFPGARLPVTGRTKLSFKWKAIILCCA